MDPLFPNIVIFSATDLLPAPVTIVVSFRLLLGCCPLQGVAAFVDYWKAFPYSSNTVGSEEIR